ncbi:MAG: glycosyltransferase family 2 protein [Anaerolineae bacterium]|nr:glycosyltransferase family 2 protein [Anaerolineae bacterium]
MTRPVLSIGIPTYNHAPLLKSALYSILPTVRELHPLVEVVVSDNCSADDTEAVVRMAEAWGPVSYVRNERNLGMMRNLLQLYDTLLTGTFLWVIGDDDLIRPEGIKRVLKVIETNPDVDYIFANTSPRHEADRTAFNRLVNSDDFPDLWPAKAAERGDYAATFEALIDPKVDETFLGSIMCSVVRASRWREHQIQLSGEAQFGSTLPESYPNIMILAQTMVNRKAYYIGYPCSIAFWGVQNWSGYQALYVLLRMQEALEYYAHCGVERERIERCRADLLERSGPALWAMLRPDDVQGREYFSVLRFIYLNRYHARKIYQMLLPILRYRLKSLLYQAVGRKRPDKLANS